MMEIIFIVLMITLLCADGIIAMHSALCERRNQVKSNKKVEIMKNYKVLDIQEEFAAIQEIVGTLRFPSVIVERGGYSGRGNPFLSRFKNKTLESVEKRIERIIR